jgi:hypothetical protein
MKNSILLLSSFTAINGLTVISCQTAEPNGKNTELVVVEPNNLSGTNIPNYKNDIVLFRQRMDKTIESNSQELSLLRKRIKTKNKQSNADFSTTIFELELANGYMKIKLEDYKPGEVDKWKIFKKKFSKEMDEWNNEFTDFTSTI